MRIVSLLAIYFFSVPFAGAVDIRQFDLKTTERLGNLLVQLSQRSDCGATTAAKRRARVTAIAALNGSLYHDVRYEYVVLDDPTEKGFLVYALATSQKKSDISTGGHYRVTVSSDGSTAKQVDLLSQLIRQPKASAGNQVVAVVSSQIAGNIPVET